MCAKVKLQTSLQLWVEMMKRSEKPENRKYLYGYMIRYSNFSKLSLIKLQHFLNCKPIQPQNETFLKLFQMNYKPKSFH